jgi:hypothetical protein
MAQLIALIDYTNRIPFADLQDVATAITIQIKEDVKPVWGKDAEVIAYQSFAEIPSYTWVTSIQNTLDIDVYGYHYVDKNGKPFATLKYRSDWSITVSHEIVEMLIDPYGTKVMNVEGFLDDDSELPDEVNGVAQILVEVSDPSQSSSFGYYITVGKRKVLVSDFYYPSYFDDSVPIKGKKYSHTGSITRPKQILEGGYISFKNRAGQWWQAFKVNGKLIFKKVGDSKETLANEDIISVLTVVLVGIGVTLLTLLITSLRRKNKQE